MRADDYERKINYDWPYRKSLRVIACNTASSKDIKEFRIEFYSHNVWFYQLRVDYMCIWEHLKEYIWSDLHFIIDEKVKILDKSWYSILYHSVANANRHLYILVLYPRTCQWLFWAVNLYSFDFKLIFFVIYREHFVLNEAKKCLSSQLLRVKFYN